MNEHCHPERERGTRADKRRATGGIRPGTSLTLAMTMIFATLALAQQSPSLFRQTFTEAGAKDGQCVTYHKGIEAMHTSAAVKLGCVDCHGGDATATTKQQAHVQPKHPELWPTSANPQR